MPDSATDFLGLKPVEVVSSLIFALLLFLAVSAADWAESLNFYLQSTQATLPCHPLQGENRRTLNATFANLANKMPA
jgi:hypothetical protein